MIFGSIIGLVLYFDGSLRPPRDKGFLTHRLGRMASCGAAVFSDDGTLLALGGKSISLVPDITCAHVEYEGLLFGLDWLDRQWDDEQLIVRGDCKAIIDQLSGQAVPHKLLSKHEAAMELLGRIGEQATVAYEHVLRKENTVCDSVCECVMNIEEQQQVSMFRNKMASLQDSARNSAPHSTLTDLVRRLVSSERSLVRFSWRPTLYKEAACVAERIGDAVALGHIGEQLVREAKLWPTCEAMKSMKANGILLQIRGLHMLNRHKEAKRLLRRHRYLLDHFASHNITLSDASVTATVETGPRDVTDSSRIVVGGGESELMLQTWYDRALGHERHLLEGSWYTKSQRNSPD